jgi:hypothetical protein
LGEEIIIDSVNAVILTPQYPTELNLLVSPSDRLLVSRDGGTSWSDWWTGLTFEQGMALVSAPQGIRSKAPLLLGLADGGGVRV